MGYGSSHDSREEGELEDEEVYCICRTSDTSRFMIGCDSCEEWYHGDCINITAEAAKKILKFFCQKCRTKDPSLENVYKEKKIPKRKPEPKPEPVIVAVPEVQVERVDPDYQPQRSPKSKYFESEDDEDDDFSVSRSAKRSSKTSSSRNTKEKKAKPGGAKRGPKPKKHGNRNEHKKQHEIGARRGHRRGTRDAPEVSEGPRHCYGPGCTEAARKSSRYCSDECGLALAKNRIVELLPNRMRQWQSTPSTADDFSRKALDKIRQEQQDARKILEELDKKHYALDKLIEDGKHALPLSAEEEADFDEKAEAENEMSIHCVSCGHEVGYRLAVRHMERCFNKYEAQTSYGSIFKTKIDNLFCDVYNAHQKTYCKRLRILCPEHSKDPKIGDDEVCGAPLYANVFDETNEFCRVYKKKCSKHFGWEKLRRAEIDMERVQQWLRIDDLFEREQKMRFTMASRGGVMGLLLHQTLAAN